MRPMTPTAGEDVFDWSTGKAKPNLGTLNLSPISATVRLRNKLILHYWSLSLLLYLRWMLTGASREKKIAVEWISKFATDKEALLHVRDAMLASTRCT